MKTFTIKIVILPRGITRELHKNEAAYADTYNYIY